MRMICSTCGGKGYVEGWECLACNGTGYIEVEVEGPNLWKYSSDNFSEISVEVKDYSNPYYPRTFKAKLKNCPACGGYGIISGYMCSLCGGVGKILEEDHI